MDFVQNTPDEIASMLRTIGVPDLESLFRSVPATVRFRGELPIPAGLTEPEVLELLQGLSRQNLSPAEVDSFLGAGKVNGFTPSVVDALSLRPEFATSYTPYQPEASQGNLQAAFEYQTMICELTGLDVSNASHYDAGTALAEAVGMAVEQTGRTKIVISQGIHPHSVQVARTYFKFRGIEFVEVPLKDGSTSLDALGEAAKDAACVAIQQPNALGCIEPMDRVRERTDGLAIASVDPISLGILKPPGKAGFDIAVGDGQALGTDPMYGGPTFGFLAAKSELIRRMPGRIVGETKDVDGRRGFVLTLQAREQHIRREKATSNICTNQALIALRAAIYLAALGKNGLPELADLCLQKAHYLADRLAEAGAPIAFPAPFFREFAVRLPRPAKDVVSALLKKNIIAGFDLGRWRAEWSDLLLVSVTELTKKSQMDRFASELKGAL